jgi:hypothetical protein
VRPGWLRLTDDYNLRGTPRLRDAAPDAERIIFNSAEYVKDGLLALTEWLGPSAWSERMFQLLDDSFALAAVDTPSGKVPMVGRNKQTGVEVSGDYLQALSRAYWISGGQEKYLEWGRRLADYYLLPASHSHPTRDFSELRLRDHGCEIISGLCEFYVALDYAGRKPGGAKWAALKASYAPHVHEMLDRALAVGRNADGLFYNSVNPQTGQVIDGAISDSWGYVFDAYYAVFMIDGTAAYRDAAFRPLGVLSDKYRGFAWEPSSNARGNPKGRTPIRAPRRRRRGSTARRASCGRTSGRTGSSRRGTATATSRAPPSCTACGRRKASPRTPGARTCDWAR